MMGRTRRGILILVLLACAPTLLPSAAQAAIDPETLATRIAESLKEGLKDTSYQTVAISRIREVGRKYNVEDLIDFTNVKIVRARRLKVIDRSKLELILKEQQVRLHDFVSAQKYQQLGKLMGVDIFIYGTFYKDALVLKGIDVQNSAIVWADVFPTEENPAEARLLSTLGQGMVRSLEKDAVRLKNARIRLVSFWDMETEKGFSSKSVMDYLSVSLTRDGKFRVVDRENLRLITGEQQLNQAVFIDQKNAKRLGELYGVDGFIYGGIKRRRDGSYLASLKMMNILNGVIEWADLIHIEPGMASAKAGQPSDGPRKEGDMIYIPSGMFLRGSNDGPAISGPLHKVDLPAFFIDQTEVSNTEYLKFIRSRKYRSPVGWSRGKFPPDKADHPVVGVTWDDARRYCAFQGKRLPAESEWEKAARGTSGMKYPWGSDTFSPGFTVTRESGRKSTVSVHKKTRDMSPYQVMHLSGNVREWVEDTLSSYRGGGASPSQGEIRKVIRGGSWATDYKSATTFHRDGSKPTLAWPDVGFRCARSG